MDERVFSDTIFRAEKVKNQYVISDVFVYNSSCIFDTSTFKQRYEWSKKLLARFYRPGLTVLIHKSDLPSTIALRGNEVYDCREGSRGCFVEIDTSETIIRTEIPDVYTVVGKQGYVLVPTLKISAYLRSKGGEFKLKCTQKDGNWVVTEFIPEVK